MKLERRVEKLEATKVKRPDFDAATEAEYQRARDALLALVNSHEPDLAEDGLTNRQFAESLTLNSPKRSFIETIEDIRSNLLAAVERNRARREMEDSSRKSIKAVKSHRQDDVDEAQERASERLKDDVVLAAIKNRREQRILERMKNHGHGS